LSGEQERAILRARDDELWADAVAAPHRPASLDDLEGAQAPRRFASSPSDEPADELPLRMGAGRRFVVGEALNESGWGVVRGERFEHR
jgi:hypothetical protein